MEDKKIRNIKLHKILWWFKCLLFALPFVLSLRFLFDQLWIDYLSYQAIVALSVVLPFTLLNIILKRRLESDIVKFEVYKKLVKRSWLLVLFHLISVLVLFILALVSIGGDIAGFGFGLVMFLLVNYFVLFFDLKLSRQML